MPKYHVDRSIEINVSPEKAFAAVSDFSTWTTWSPWLIAEPDAVVKVTEDPSSVGSIYSWEGEVTGAGAVQHEELHSPTTVRDEIRFLKPFKSVAKVGFDIEAVGDGSRVTWSMDGSMPFFLFWMIPAIKCFIGMDYERGLKMLKEWLETGQIESKTTFNPNATIGPLKVVGLRQKVLMKDIGPAMETAIRSTAEQLEAAGISTCGEVVSVFHHLNVRSGMFEFTAGYAIPDSVTPPEGMSVWSTPTTKAFHAEHIGRYEHLGNAWSAANQHVRYKKMKQSKVGTFEIYRNSPEDTPAAELHTDIYLPLK